MLSNKRLRTVLVLLLITVLFHWRILLTSEFSLLTLYENVNQAYSWYNFWIATLHRGIYPLWDPYTFGGHPFAGEMQTGAFYPLNFLFALFPFSRNGLFSPTLYHGAYTLTHVAGAYFLYLLAGELGMEEFPALVAGICFSLGGTLSHYEGWPHLLQSGIWLPLIFLFLLRAFRSKENYRVVENALLSGLFLGLSILAGGLHLVMMQAIVVVTAAAFQAFRADRAGRIRAGLAFAVVALTSFATGAVQLFPSFEYSRLAYRFLGNAMIPATRKIPYAYMSDKLFPNGLIHLLFPTAFDGRWATGEVTNGYIGVFPLLLAGIGVWRYWSNPWVRYLSVVGLGALIYSLGDLSFLHGLLYAVVPDLWMAREAPRFLYLTDFALVLFAGFGAQIFFATARDHLSLERLTRALNWVAIACAAVLAVPALFGKPDVNPWIAFSLLLVVSAWAVYRFIAAGQRGRGAQALVLALVLFDLYAWDWGPRDKILQASNPNGDEMERLHSVTNAAKFLRSRPGPYRVQIDGNIHPNIGDAYGIEAMNGGAVTLLQNFADFRGHADLLNVRYILRPASAAEPGAIYQDAAWKVYENKNAYPRAWLVHRMEETGSADEMRRRLDTPGFDAHSTALVENTAVTALDPAPPEGGETIYIKRTEPGALDIRVHSAGRAMLVLSEMFYPGWNATVHRAQARILQVDGALRGVVIPPGDSDVVLRYRPISVYSGAVLTFLAFFGVPSFVLLIRRHKRTHKEVEYRIGVGAE